MRLPQITRHFRVLLFLGLCVPSLAQYVLSKRTMASSNGSADTVFWTQYFGKADPSSTHSDCLDRWLQHALPDNIGMHFPTSMETPSVPAGSNGTMTLADWDRKRISMHASSVQSDRKNGFHDFATSFYVPNLGAHVQAFDAGSVPFLGRQYDRSAGTRDRMYVLIVVTPGNGHTLELQSPECTGCDMAHFPPFGPTECGESHRLSKSLAYYQQAWEYGTSLAGWAKSLPNSALPTPMMADIRAAVTAVTDAEAYLHEYLAGVNTTTSSDEYGCRWVETTVDTMPFAAQRLVTNYSVGLRWTMNRAAWVPGPLDWASWTEWVSRLHRDYVGEGWGYDRVLDYHIKLNDEQDLEVTKKGVSLDHYAALHTQQGRRFHSFNTSQSCPGSGPSFFGAGFMMYSEGIEGTSGFELWGDVDFSFFGHDQPLFGWNDCSPSMGCTYGHPEPMCSAGSSARMRARVPNDWPTNLAQLTLECPNAISKVAFASFGNPLGGCGAGFQKGSCDANMTMQVVQKLCLGKKRCVVPTTPTLYGGDVCPEGDWPVSLAVDVACN